MSIPLRNTSRKFLYIEKTILIFLTILYIYIYIFFHKIGINLFFFFFNDSLINALKAFRPFLKIYT